MTPVRLKLQYSSDWRHYFNVVALVKLMLTGLWTTVHKICVPYANINNKIWHMLVSPKFFSFVSAVILQIQFSIMVWTKLMEALVVLIKYTGDTSCKAPLENLITYSDIHLRASRFLSRMSKRWPYICCFGSSNHGVDLFSANKWCYNHWISIQHSSSVAATFCCWAQGYSFNFLLFWVRCIFEKPYTYKINVKLHLMVAECKKTFVYWDYNTS